MKQKFPSRGTILKLIEQSLDEGREKQVIERLQWFLHYSTHGSVSKTCKEFEIARSTFYRWLNRFDINDFSKLTDNSTNSLQLTTNNQKLLLGSRAAFLLALFLINLGVLLFALPTLASAASSWNPTLLVNTEAFQQIDDDDTDSDVYLEFGDTLQEKLLYKRSETRFETTRDLRVAGALTATGSIASSGSITASGNLALNSDNGAINATITFGNDSGAETLTFNDTSNAFDLSDDLNVTGTMSGKRLSFGDHFSGSGTVKWQNITDSTTQFQILDADGGNPVLNVDTTNERVGIGTSSPSVKLDIRGKYSQRPLSDDAAVWQVLSSGGSIRARLDTTGGDASFLLRNSANTYTVSLASDGSSYFIGGNVGIGTASPIALQHNSLSDTDTTWAAATDQYGLVLQNSSDTDNNWAQLVFRATDTNAAWIGTQFTDNGLGYGDLVFGNRGAGGASENMRIDSAGNVGIGTASPDYDLHLENTGGDTVLAVTDTNGIAKISVGYIVGQGLDIYRNSGEADIFFDATQGNGKVRFQDAGADTLTIDEDGNVGIGTMSPTANLMIAQSANGTGALIDSEATTAPALAIDAVATPAQVANAPHILFGYRGMFDVKMYRSGTGALRVASESGTTLAVDTESSTATDIAFKIVSDKSSDENTVFKVQADGKTFADGAYSGGGADYAEWFPTQEENLKPGNPVCIDVENDRSVESCTGKLSDIFVGVVSTNPGFIGGHTDELNSGTWVLVGLVGQVMVDVSDETGLIKRGDVLTPADTPGVARKATPWDKNHKGIALIAIENQEEPRDKIKVLLK